MEQILVNKDEYIRMKEHSDRYLALFEFDVDSKKEFQEAMAWLNNLKKVNAKLPWE
jgi:hypothetical protein